MDAGLEVINDTGILQINSQFRNYLLQTKLILSGALYNEFPRYGYFYQFTAPNGSMIACQPVDGTFISLHSTIVGNDITTYIFMSPMAPGPLITSPVCTFYVFSLLITPPSATSGLEVYDSTGKLVFSSQATYMTPVQAWSGGNYNLITTNYMIGQGGFGYYGTILSTAYPRSNYAVVFGSPSGSWGLSSTRNDDNTWDLEEDIYACFMGWRGTQLIMANELMGGRSGQATGPLNNSYSYSQYYIMLVDVTKLM